MTHKQDLLARQNINITPPFETLDLISDPFDQGEVMLFDEQEKSGLSGSRRKDTMNYQQKQLSLLMNHTKDAIWIVDAALLTLDINPAACYLLDWDAEKVIGQSFLTAPANKTETGHQVLVKYLEQAIITGKKISFNRGISLHLDHKRSILVEGVAHPLLEQETVVGAALIFRPASPSRGVEQMQADFIALASHNLRNPLMSIQIALDSVLNTESDPEKTEQLLAEARRQSQKIAYFLQDILDISKLTLDREIPLRIQAVDLTALIQSILVDDDDQMIGIDCRLEMPANLPPISADEAKMMLVLRNLIAHAKGRSKMNTAVIIRAAVKAEEVILSIVDHGPPIPSQQRRQIFWQVYPLEAVETNGNHNSIPYGYAFGLYSTRRLVELLGGHIWISRSNRRETCFSCSLPIWR